MKKYIVVKFLSIAFSSFLLFGCESHSNIDNALRSISLARFAKDYPHGESTLKHCIENQELKCFKLYQRAKSGKDNLLKKLDISYNRAIELMFSSKCMGKIEIKNLPLCQGSFMFPYFLDNETYDKKLLNTFKNQDPKLTAKFFSETQWAWYSNRPLKNDWINYLNSIPDKLFMGKSSKKANILKYFNSTIDDYPYLKINF